MQQRFLAQQKQMEIQAKLTDGGKMLLTRVLKPVREKRFSVVAILCSDKLSRSATGMLCLL